VEADGSESPARSIDEVRSTRFEVLTAVDSMCSTCDQSQRFIRVPVDSMPQTFQNRIQRIQSIKVLTAQRVTRINAEPVVPPNVYHNIHDSCDIL